MTTTETITRYRKRPIEIEARLFDPAADYDEACAVIGWCGGRATDDGCEISTLEGVMLARPGDWIIRGVKGEFYPCKPDIFTATYEPAGAEDEIVKLQRACHLMGRVITGNGRAMEAARIEMAQGSAEKAMEWILNSLPDVSDEDPEDQWNGTETAQEWFDRTDERRAVPAPAPSPAESEMAGQLPLPGVTAAPTTPEGEAR